MSTTSGKRGTPEPSRGRRARLSRTREKAEGLGWGGGKMSKDGEERKMEEFVDTALATKYKLLLRFIMKLRVGCIHTDRRPERERLRGKSRNRKRLEVATHPMQPPRLWDLGPNRKKSNRGEDRTRPCAAPTRSPDPCPTLRWKFIEVLQYGPWPKYIFAQRSDSCYFKCRVLSTSVRRSHHLAIIIRRSFRRDQNRFEYF